MKNIILAITALLICNCCKKNDDDVPPTDPIDQLPPATQIGANTAGCLVDGEAFLPDRNSTTPLRLFYLDGKTFGFVISKEINDRSHKVLLFLEDVQIEVGKEYSLNTEFDDNEDNQSGEYSIASIGPPSPYYYTTNSIVTGKIIFTNHDFDNAILSGTFWFDAINSNDDIVEVREGRFDVEY